MANAFFTAEQATDTVARIARLDLGLAKLVHTDVASAFKAGGSHTVHVPVPGVTTTNTRPVGSTTDYVLGAIAETTIPVQLTAEAYSTVPLTLADNTLELADYARQVLRPQALTVATHIDETVAAVFNASVADTGITYDAASPRKAVIAARAKLRANGVSADRPLAALVGSQVYADMLLANEIDENGKISGVTVHESTRVPSDALHVFVREAVALALKAPEVPAGAPFGSTVVLDEPDAGQMSLRYYRAMNPANGVELSTVSVFVGARAMPLPVADFATGSVGLVDGGGIVTVDTAAA